MYAFGAISAARDKLGDSIATNSRSKTFVPVVNSCVLVYAGHFRQLERIAFFLASSKLETCIQFDRYSYNPLSRFLSPPPLCPCPSVCGVASMLLVRQEASISKAGELETLSEAVSSFVHVDLKGNLLSDWQEVNWVCFWWR